MRRHTRTIRLSTVLGAALVLGCQSSVEPRRPVQLVLDDGAAQSANVGSPLAVPPAVRVLNVDGQPVVGAQVTFTIANGGGSITGGSTTTDADGVAAIGSWTIGSVGENQLTASTTGALPLTISAVGRCVAGSTLAIDATASGTLGNTDCHFPGGEFTDRYTITIAAQRALRFTQTSVALDAFLEVQGASNVIGFNNDATTTTDNSSFRALLPAGSYDVNPSSWEPARTGAYSVTAAAAPENEAGCEIFFSVPGIETVQTLATNDCASGTFRYDAVGIYLHAGQTYTFSMNSPAFDTYLELLNYGSQQQVAENDDANAGTTNARISYSPTVSGFYLLLASNRLATGLGNYTLIITGTQPAATAR